MKTITALRFWSGLALLVMLAALAGCTSKRIVWSPDGAQAAVLGAQGLFLCNGEGKLSRLLVPDVVLAEWFPDSRRLALVRRAAAKSWGELEPVLAPDQRARVIQGAQLVVESLKRGQDLAIALAAPKDLSAAETNALSLYLKDLPEAKAKLAEMGGQTMEVATYGLQVGTVANSQIASSPPLARSLQEIAEVRVAPSGSAIAYVTDPGENHAGVLKVVPADGSRSPQVVAERTGAYPDWSPDGHALVYLKATGVATSKDQILLASLTRRGVLTADGRIDLQPKEEDLVGLLFDDACKVRCLKDGRILFASYEIHLPTTAGDCQERQQLFALDPERQATITRIIPRSVQNTFPDSLRSFEVSPDGKRLCVLGENNAVVVFTLATGDVQIVQAPQEVEVGGSTPVWRSANELCFVAAQKTNNAAPPAQIALWDNGQTRVLSRDWPAEVRKGLLEK